MNPVAQQTVPASMRLPPDVNRILYVKSLPHKITTEDMYDIFGKYGAIRQIRLGASNHTRGTAYVVYEDIFEAKAACENLNGFHVAGMYLIVCYYPHYAVAWKRIKGYQRDILMDEYCTDHLDVFNLRRRNWFSSRAFSFYDIKTFESTLASTRAAIVHVTFNPRSERHQKIVSITHCNCESGCVWSRLYANV